ncbi:uncharacterized protein LOC134020564 [Osmerus eperlanus]|uniref:uncharacterized protein LOC134020564 n=1 Tax=Osmerus eperlanus TaxID=29151 RepID=UPI002E15045B
MKPKKPSDMPGAKMDGGPWVSPGSTRTGNTFDNRETVIDVLEGRDQSAPNSSETEDVCYPMIIQFLKNLTNEQWLALRQSMHNPESREKMSKACQEIVKVITMTAFRLLVPAIMEVLKQEDLEAPVTSKRQPQSAMQRPETDDPLRTLFGVTEETILQSLRATSPSSSPELTSVLVGEIVRDINSSISAVVSTWGSFSPVPGCSRSVKNAIKQMGRVIHVGLQRLCLCKKPGETLASEGAFSEAGKASTHMEVLSDPDFQKNASRAVSGILKKQAISSSSESSTCASASASLMNMWGSVPPSKSNLSLAHAQSAASVIIQCFVSDMEDVSMHLWFENGTTPKPESTLSEAKMIYGTLQARLRNFFTLPSSTVSEQLPVDEELELCTKEVMSLILDAYRSEFAAVGWPTLKMDGASPMSSPPQRPYMEQLISHLEKLTIASSWTEIQLDSSTNANLYSIGKLSPERILNKVKDGVTEVLLKKSVGFKSAAHSFPPSEIDIDNAASDIITSFVSDVKDIAQAIKAVDVQGQADVEEPPSTERDATESSPSHNTRRHPSISENIFSATVNLYKNLQKKLSQGPKNEKPTFTSEEKLVTSTHSGLNERTIFETFSEAQSSVCLQQDMSRSEEMENSEELSQLQSMVGAMLKSLEGIKGFDEEPPRTGELGSEKMLEGLSTLPGTPIPKHVPAIASPIVRSTIINTSIERKPALSPRVSDVVSIILDHVDPKYIQVAISPGDGPTTALQRLEQIISEGRISDLSRDLVDQLLGAMSDDMDTLLADTSPPERGVSDTVLSGSPRTGEQPLKLFTSELIYSFTEESVKRLLLPLLLPPLGTSQKQTASQDVTSSPHVSRCPRNRPSSGCSVGSDSSVLYNDTVNLFTKAMVQQVMDILSPDSKSSAKSSTSPTLSGRCNVKSNQFDGLHKEEDSAEKKMIVKKAKSTFNIVSTKKDNVQSTQAAEDQSICESANKTIHHRLCFLGI